MNTDSEPDLREEYVIPALIEKEEPQAESSPQGPTTECRPDCLPKNPPDPTEVERHG